MSSLFTRIILHFTAFKTRSTNHWLKIRAWKMQGLHFFCEEFTSDSVLNTLFRSLSKCFRLEDARSLRFLRTFKYALTEFDFRKNHMPWLRLFLNTLVWIVCDLWTHSYQWNKIRDWLNPCIFTYSYLYSCYVPIEDDKMFYHSISIGWQGPSRNGLNRGLHVHQLWISLPYMKKTQN